MFHKFGIYKAKRFDAGNFGTFIHLNIYGFLSQAMAAGTESENEISAKRRKQITFNG
jgi:hypothetical protein